MTDFERKYKRLYEFSKIWEEDIDRFSKIINKLEDGSVLDMINTIEETKLYVSTIYMKLDIMLSDIEKIRRNKQDHISFVLKSHLQDEDQ